MEDFDEIRAYINNLKEGERVVETSRSCMYNKKGTVYINEGGGVCVMWDLDAAGNRMGTSATGGTRRLSEQ